MDLLWRGPGFTNAQYNNFKYAEDLDPIPTTRVVHFSPDAARPIYEGHHSKTLNTTPDWDGWLEELPKSDAAGPASASIIFFPRKEFDLEVGNLSEREVASLVYLPVTQPVFMSVVDRMYIHQAFQLAVNRGQAMICRLDENTGLKRRSYILRSSNSFTHDLALSLTHFPEKKRLYATFLGCMPDDIKWIQSRLKFGTGKTALAPLTLISAFLELEKRNRFDDVNSYDRRMFELVENFSDETSRSQAYAWPSEDDPKDLVRTSRAVTFMKGHLEKWKNEVAGLQSVNCADQPEKERDFQKLMDDPVEAANKIPLIDPDPYLSRLAAEYEDKIRKCDAILGTASLAFQMETSGNARKEADKVKIIAVLTMVFLPATFLSTLFAIPMFEWRPEKPAEDDSKPPGQGGQDGKGDGDDGVVSLWFWKLYIPLSVGLTLFVLVIYWCWKPAMRALRRRKQARKAATSTV
ncbi:hypothetical protein QBC37DRAFT_419516 [Rhypophila decipiens]|uniref:Uncharacterized protein n=1 Tax=Rhypophila decipiens TaxID=261697 RepID=A0AAN6YC82_9PEZI|nr:hypothetical protein QBC37DRAFT_419516 [Rhypophila decipiens]